MISPLQKTPLGLLQGYNIQTLGQAPSAFGDTVVPVSSADLWYLRDLVQPLAFSTVIPIGQLTGIAELTVTDAAAWYVYGVRGAHGPAAGDTAFEVSLSLRATIQGASVIQFLRESFLPGVTSMTNGSDQVVGYWLPQPFLLRPGDSIQVGYNASAVATGPHSLSGVLTAAVLR